MDQVQSGIDALIAKSTAVPPVPLTAQEQVTLATDFLIKSIMIQWKYPDIAFKADEQTLAKTNGINGGYITENELVDNPYFHIKSPTQQPGGYKTIEWKGQLPSAQSYVNETETKKIAYLTAVKDQASK